MVPALRILLTAPASLLIRIDLPQLLRNSKILATPQNLQSVHWLALARRPLCLVSHMPVAQRHDAL